MQTNKYCYILVLYCIGRVIPWSVIKSKKAVSNEDEYLSEDDLNSDDSADYML